MNTMQTLNLTRVSGLAIAALALTQMASAASITYQVNVPDPPTAPAAPDPAHTVAINGSTKTTSVVSFPMFDPSLGTLFQVDRGLTVNYYYDDFFTNPSGSDQDVLISIGVATRMVINNVDGFPGPLATPLTGYFLLPGHTIELTGSLTDTSSFSQTLPAFLSPYLGSGLVYFVGDFNNDAIDTGSISKALSGGFNAALTLTYDYTPTAAAAPAPEPASFFAMGGGLVALAIAARRLSNR